MSMLIEHMAICPFCGQNMIVESEGNMSGEELAEEARGRCGCEYAKEWRMKRDAHAKIDALCGHDSLEAGFDYEMTPDVLEALKRTADALIGTCFRNAVITTAGGDIVKMTREPNSVAVRRTSKKQLQM